MIQSTKRPFNKEEPFNEELFWKYLEQSYSRIDVAVNPEGRVTEVVVREDLHETDFMHLQNLEYLDSLFLSTVTLSQLQIEALPRNLKSLTLQVGDRTVLDSLAGMQIVKLFLGGVEHVSDVDWSVLNQLPKLSSLTIESAGIPPAEMPLKLLAAIEKCQLKELGLERFDFSDMPAIPSLETFTLSDCQCSHNSGGKLVGTCFPNLKRFSLQGTAVNDFLIGFTHTTLERLLISECDDVSLDLEPLSASLTLLLLYNTQVAEAKLEALQAEFPSVKIRAENFR